MDLATSLKKVLANTFTMYLKTHKYHWNVEGANFAEYHGFLSDLYTELFGAVDTTAEQIRALNEYAPGSYTEFFAFSDIKDETGTPLPMTMFQTLLADNGTVIQSLNTAHQLASEANNRGLVNFIEGRLDVHAKHGWMLRSFTK